MFNEEAKQAAQILLDAGFQAFYVGGCVRDTLMGRKFKDIDLATDALPDQTMKLFKKAIPTGVDHGTVTVVFPNNTFEITTFREDREHDGRRAKVVFSKTLKEDLARRDFTVNAMAFDIEGNLTDLFDGQGDLKRRLIRAVGDPMQRFNEDRLRIVRAMRFVSQFHQENKGWTIDPLTWDAICKFNGKL